MGMHQWVLALSVAVGPSVLPNVGYAQHTARTQFMTSAGHTVQLAPRMFELSRSADSWLSPSDVQAATSIGWNGVIIGGLVGAAAGAYLMYDWQTSTCEIQCSIDAKYPIGGAIAGAVAGALVGGLVDWARTRMRR